MLTNIFKPISENYKNEDKEKYDIIIACSILTRKDN